MNPRILTSLQYVYTYQNQAGKTVKAHTIRGVCRARAKDLIDSQYRRRKRCVCGKKGLFCEFDPRASRKRCSQLKNKRIMKLAARLSRKIKEAKKYHDRQKKPAIEFVYEFDVCQRSSSKAGE